MSNNKPKKKLVIIVLIIILFSFIAITVSIISLITLYKKSKGLDNQSSDGYFREVAQNNQEVSYEDGVCFVNNTILISINDSTKVKEIENDYSANVISLYGEDFSFYSIVFNDNLSYEEIQNTVNELKSKEYINDAWINNIYCFSKQYYPSDPWGGSGWDESNPSGNNWNLEAINMPSAWEKVNSTEKIKVGIIDEGIDNSHEDLTNVVAESASNNVDDHATLVAGIIAANWNDKGMSGIAANNCEIYDAYAHENVLFQADYDSLSESISYFVWLLSYKEVQVINYSVGYDDDLIYGAYKGNSKALERIDADKKAYTDILKEIIVNREEKGLNDFVICVSAGNTQKLAFNKSKNADYGYKVAGLTWFTTEYLSNSDDIALYGSPLSIIDDEEVMNHIIVVGAIEHKESRKKGTTYKIADYSTRGKRVDVLAPGTDIYSTSCGNKYKNGVGTSFAAPHVSGVATLLFALKPDISATEVKSIICKTGLQEFESCEHKIRMIDANEAIDAVLSNNMDIYVESNLIEGDDENGINYDTDIDKRELSRVLLYLKGMENSEDTQFQLESLWDRYYTYHETIRVDRDMTGTYDVEYFYHDFATPVQIKKDIFDSWLYYYFDTEIENVNYEPNWSFIFEEDDEYYYFYYEIGYASIMEYELYIYDIQFNENEAIVYAYDIVDYEEDFDKTINLSREEVLTDDSREYIGCCEIHLKPKDGRLVYDYSKELDIPLPYKYVGIAIDDTKYTDIKSLLQDFKEGEEKEGYTYAEEWGDPVWSLKGWEGGVEPMDCWVRQIDPSADSNTTDPVYVHVVKPISGNIYAFVVYSDNSYLEFFDGNVYKYSHKKVLAD